MAFDDLEAVRARLDDQRYAATRAHLDAVRRAATQRDLDRPAIDRAIAWAMQLHADQAERPDGAPYVEHVAAVADFVATASPRIGTAPIVAALLHDAVEDQAERLAAEAPDPVASADPRPRAFAVIEAAHGPRVRALVGHLTNPDFGAIITREHGQQRGTAAYRALSIALYTTHFVEIFLTDREAALIKLADFSSNALSLERVRHRPEVHAWLVRKYGPCIQFTIDHLESLTDPDDPLVAVRERMLPALREAWTRAHR